MPPITLDDDVFSLLMMPFVMLPRWTKSELISDRDALLGAFADCLVVFSR